MHPPRRGIPDRWKLVLLLVVGHFVSWFYTVVPDENKIMSYDDNNEIIY